MKRLIFSLFLISPSLAFGLGLDAAKANGLVGETPSGYLEAVKPNPGKDVLALVSEINGKRKAKYQSIAKKNGTSLGAVQKLAGEKAIKKTAPGGYVKLDGRWKRK